MLSHAGDYPELSRVAGKAVDFTQMMDDLRRMAADPENSLHFLYTTMLETTGYLAMWKEQGDMEAGRVENLEELSSTIQQYEKNCGEDFPDLAGFLEEQALMTDIDNYDTDADATVLMTMHAAKGLEFPVVLLAGFEDGIFPAYQTMFDPTELEEDRRLCYVAITRAREELYITRAASRMLYGQTTRNAPSRFVADIPHELVEEVDRRSAPTMDFGGGYGGSRYGQGSGGYGGYGERTYTSTHSHAAFTSTADRPSGSRSTVAETMSKATACAWKVGDRVVHASFGEGVITAMTPMAGDTLLVILFDKLGQKKLMANYAKLTAK